MTKSKFVFSYTEIRDFEEPLEVTMEVPERSIDEMCEYFQRFLTAAGYLFENDETIRCVPTEARKCPYPTSVDDTISFNNCGTPFVYEFGYDTDHSPWNGGLRGGMVDDIIRFD